MFEEIFKKNNLKKQKQCLEYIKDLLDEESIYIYNTSNGLIKYHEEFFDKGLIRDSVLSNPLYAIKYFYQKDLNKREQDLKNIGDDSVVSNIKQADQMLLDVLTDEFISKYEDIITKLHQVERLQDFLTEQQKETINIVLKDYGDKSPQYLVALSHSEDPWKDARIGYGPGERCTNEISDESIAEYYTSLL